MTLPDVTIGLASSGASTEFKISTDLVSALQDDFGFVLTSREIAWLETAAAHTIRDRRVALGRGERDGRRRQCIEMKSRRAKIVKTINELRRLLDADERAERIWRLNTSMNRLFVSPSVRDDVMPSLEFVEWLALQPHPLEDLSTQAWELRRRKNIDHDGWDDLILATMEIFLSRRIPPTANYSQGKYVSPLLRGLAKLHDAMPADVRASSGPFALGSPAAEWIKKVRKRLKKEAATQQGKAARH